MCQKSKLAKKKKKSHIFAKKDADLCFQQHRIQCKDIGVCKDKQKEQNGEEKREKKQGEKSGDRFWSQDMFEHPQIILAYWQQNSKAVCRQAAALNMLRIAPSSWL